MAVLQQVVI